MADELCEIMYDYKEGDLLSQINVTERILELSKQEAYEKVTSSQLKRSMKKKCPEGWKKYESFMKQ